MDLIEILRRGGFLPCLKSEDKDGVIEELVTLLVESHGIRDRQAVLDCVLERESKMSTGMQYGIAIPHGKTSAVSDLVMAVALKPDGVDFKALDGEPSSIFVITVSPPDTAGNHIQFLSALSKALSDEEARSAVLKAQTLDELLQVFSHDDADAT